MHCMARHSPSLAGQKHAILVLGIAGGGATRVLLHRPLRQHAHTNGAPFHRLTLPALAAHPQRARRQSGTLAFAECRSSLDSFLSRVLDDSDSLADQRAA